MELGFGGLLPLEYDNAAAFVAGGQEFAVLVELDSADDVGLVDLLLGGALYLREVPLHVAARVHGHFGVIRFPIHF